MANNTTSETLNAIIFKLSAVKQGSGWQAKCPAHDDKTPSLSIGQGKDGKILLHCHTGCSTQSIITALGLEMSDLFAEKKTKAVYKFECAYDYRDESNQLLFQSVRKRLTNPHECPEAKPKDFTQRRPNESGGWTYDLKGVRRVLYRLPDLAAAHAEATVFIVEGEKDADRLAELGLIATTNPMGVGKWREDFNELLHGRDVVILPDNDQPGRDHAQNVAKHLQGIAASIRILELPKQPKAGDVSDWLDAGGEVETLCAMAESAPAWTPTDSAGPTTKAQPSKAKKLDVIDLASEKATFFHDQDNRHYASIKIGSHIETYPVASLIFRIWLAGIYFEATGAPLYGDALKEAVATIQALAQYQGAERGVALRLAQHDGKLYLDLCDSEWRVVEIRSDDWQVIHSTESPITFIRRAAMQALPEPVKGGSISELRSFLNVEDDPTWALMISWLVMTFHPTGPYPILSVCGEQGSAKTTACKILRSLIDPNKADLRAVPKEERDLMIAASNSWVLGYDNLSGITQELSDSLCRVATGAGFATRTLHTDSEETIFSVRRPILTNGIVDVANFPDLLDRTVSVFLRSIPEEQRREEDELWPAFNEVKPRILGALLTAVSHALKHRGTVPMKRRPRMADFARWAVAAEQGLGLKKESFFAAYESNRSATNEIALDTSPAMEIRAFVEKLPAPMLPDAPVWEGKASELLKELNQMLIDKGEDPKQKKEWPKGANWLTGKLRRIAPNLRAIGIDIDCGRTNGGSLVTIKRLPQR